MNADQWLEQLKDKNPDLYRHCDHYVLDDLKKVYTETHSQEQNNDYNQSRSKS